jgi:hypothetical protein
VQSKKRSVHSCAYKHCHSFALLLLAPFQLDLQDVSMGGSSGLVTDECVSLSLRMFLNFSPTLVLFVPSRCIQRDPYNHSEVMYELYTHSVLNYLLEKVGPALASAQKEYDVAFLKEWKMRWANQKLVVQGLAKLFMYLDRFYTPVSCSPETRLPSLSPLASSHTFAVFAFSLSCLSEHGRHSDLEGAGLQVIQGEHF